MGLVEAGLQPGLFLECGGSTPLSLCGSLLGPSSFFPPSKPASFRSAGFPPARLAFLPTHRQDGGATKWRRHLGRSGHAGSARTKSPIGEAEKRPAQCGPPTGSEHAVSSATLSKDESMGHPPKGKIVDLVLLDADPLQDIHNTTKISEVFLGGKEFDRAALDQMLKTAETAASVSAQLPSSLSQPVPEMQSLAKAFEGTWSISGQFEPSESRPNGGVSRATPTTNPLATNGSAVR